MTKFSMNLKLLREANGFSRKELADSIGISVSALGQYEQGRREPDLQKLVTIAKTLHVSVDDLLGYKVDTYGHCKDDNHRDTLVGIKIVNLLKESGMEPMDAIICLHGIESSMLKVIRDMCNDEEESEDDDE